MQNNVTDTQYEQAFAMFDNPQDTNELNRLGGMVAVGLVGALAFGACSSDSSSNYSYPSGGDTAVTIVEVEPTLKPVTATTAKPTPTTVKATTTTSTTEAPTTTSEAPTTSSSEVAATSTTEETRQIGDNVFEATDIGEHPCGPKTDQLEIEMRLRAGQVVVKPGQTFDHLNNNPDVEKGLNDFYKFISQGDTAWVDYLNEKPVTQPEILGSHVAGTAVEDKDVRGLKARMVAKQSTADMHIQNFSCNPETGAIYANSGPNGKYNNLPAGTQFWTIELSKDEQQDMKDKGIKLPESLVTVDGEDGALEIVMERALCNNPLLELPPVETPPTPTPTPTTEKPTPTTTPTPSTTTPPTTVPPTTTPPSTTTPPTTVPPTTIPLESTTTSSTLPDKVEETPNGGAFPSTTIEAPKPGPSTPTTSTVKPAPSTTDQTGTTVYKGPVDSQPQTSTSITTPAGN